MFKGRVPTELAEEKANMNAGRMPLKKYSGLIFLLICYVIVIIFSRSGYFADSAFLYENRFFIYLGAISTPFYFLQNLVRCFVPVLFNGKSLRLQVFMIYALTIALAVAAYEVIGKKRYRVHAGK